MILSILIKPMVPDLSALPDSEFAAEVSQAFRNYASLLNLSRSPLATGALIGPALVLDAASPTADDRGRALRVMLRWAVNRLAPGPMTQHASSPDFADPFWSDPRWRGYIILYYRYLQPLSTDDLEDLNCDTLTNALLNLTGIAGEHNLFDERNRAIHQTAALLREQLIQHTSDDEVRRLAVEEVCQSLPPSSTAYAVLELAATFRGAFPRVWLLKMADNENLNKAAAVVDDLIRARLLVEGDAGANLLTPTALQIYLHTRQSTGDRLRRHQAAAEFYRQECMPLEAAWHLIMGERPRQAADVLLPAADELISNLQLEELRDVLLQLRDNQLPMEIWRDVQALLTDLWWKTGDREAALAACRRALKLTPDPARQAHLYRVLGKLHEDHNPRIALGHYAEADRLFAPADPERAALLKDRAWLRIHRREWATAEADLTLALGLIETALPVDSTEAKRQRADIHNALSGLYREQRQYERAIDHAQQALTLRETLGNAALTADSYTSLGLSYAEMGEPEHARRAFTAALEIFQKMGYQERIASARMNLGGAHHYAGHNDQAIIAYQASLDIFQKLALPRGQAQAHYNLAEAYVAQGEMGLARQHWGTGVALGRREELKGVVAEFEQLRKDHPGLEPVDALLPDSITPSPEDAALSREEQLALALAHRQTRVTTKDLVEQNIARPTAKRLLSRLADQGLLRRVGQGRAAGYVLPGQAKSEE